MANSLRSRPYPLLYVPGRQARQALTPWAPQGPAPLRLLASAWQWVVRQLQRFLGFPQASQTMLLARTGLEEVGALHRYAADTVVASLAEAEGLLQVLPTAAQESALAVLTADYLQLMLAVVEEAGIAFIAGCLQRRPLEEIGEEAQSRLDRLSAFYLQRVRDTLAKEERA